MQIRPTVAIGLLSTLTIAAIAVAVAVLVWKLRHDELARALSDSKVIAQMLRDETGQSLNSIDFLLRATQERLQTPFGQRLALDSPPVHLMLGTKAAGVPALKALFLVDANGMVVNTSQENAADPISVAKREYFRTFADSTFDGLYIGKPVRALRSKTWTLHLARRFVDSRGVFRGVVVAAIDLEHLERIYQTTAIDFVRPSALYSADGALVASIPHRGGEIGEHIGALDGAMPALGNNNLTVFRPAGGQGRPRIFVLGRVPNYPFVISVADDEEEALASWRETAVPIVFGAALVSLFIAVVALLLIGRVRQGEALRLALREVDDCFHLTLDSVMDAIVAIDDQHRITIFNPAAERMFGYPAQEIVGKPVELLIPFAAGEEHRRHVECFMEGEGGSSPMLRPGAVTGVRADGSSFPIESTVSQTVINGKLQATAVLRDVSERRRAEAELRQVNARLQEANAQLRELSSTLQKVREEERQRISLELHDDLGQRLSGLKLDLVWLKGRLKSGSPPAHEEVDTMLGHLDEAIASVRRISSELRPVILDDLGFGDAVAWLSRDVSRRSGLTIDLDLPAAEAVVRNDLATALFRIVQESLTNIVRHANATQADIRLIRDGDFLCLTIADNGTGFADNRTRGSVGLFGMRERAMAQSGTFEIMNHVGGGTVVKVAVPIDAAFGAESAA